MITAANDIASTVREWTADEKQMALAVLIEEKFAENAEKPFAVRDLRDLSLALIQPLRFTVEELVLDDSTPHLRELRRRFETADESIPLEEFLENCRKEDAELNP
jgi:hypothetical protein